MSVDKGFKKETVTEKTTRLLSKIDEISEVSMYFIRAIYFDHKVIIDRRILLVFVLMNPPKKHPGDSQF